MAKKRRWCRVPPEVAAEVCRLAAAGYSQPAILAATSVAKGTVWRILAKRLVPAVEDFVPRAGCLGLDERTAISVGLRCGETFADIAARVGCHPSAVSREVGGRSGRASYDPVKAHRRARDRMCRPKVSKIDACPALAAEVTAGLEKLWSPQQVAARLRIDHPDDPEMQVSHEPIYKALYVQGKGALRKELAACLRTGRAKRIAHGSDQRQGCILDPVPISERPAEVEDRAVPGHWEGDLIIGAHGKSAVGTLVERTTRFTMLLHLGDGVYTAEAVREAMTAKIRTLPAELTKTITWDRGREMASHRRFTIDTDIQIYFADPHKPWQRGTNENTNGLLRQYMPKGTDLAAHTAADLDAIAASLNGRPRQTLSWDTPAEALATRLLALTP